MMEVTAKTVGSTREKAHQAFVRFAGPLVENDVLSLEEQENLNQILKLGEGHWGEEHWAPAFYAFERVLNDLSPLIDEGLGYAKASEMETRYSEASQSLSNEIILVESTYLQAIEIANTGYNALLAKDWITAIQSFAKALDTLNLVRAQSSEIVNRKLQEAYSAFETGDFETSSNLFNEVLAVHPDLGEATTGLQLIEAEAAAEVLVLEAEIVDIDEVETSLPVPQEAKFEWEESEHPTVVEADRHFSRRELKDSLKLYLEVPRKHLKSRDWTQGFCAIERHFVTRNSFDSWTKQRFLQSLGDGRVLLKPTGTFSTLTPSTQKHGVDGKRRWLALWVKSKSSNTSN